jgi:hypothetical protein
VPHPALLPQPTEGTETRHLPGRTPRRDHSSFRRVVAVRLNSGPAQASRGLAEGRYRPEASTAACLASIDSCVGKRRKPKGSGVDFRLTASEIDSRSRSAVPEGSPLLLPRPRRHPGGPSGIRQKAPPCREGRRIPWRGRPRYASRPRCQPLFACPPCRARENAAVAPAVRTRGATRGDTTERLGPAGVLARGTARGVSDRRGHSRRGARLSGHGRTARGVPGQPIPAVFASGEGQGRGRRTRMMR